jgi:DNA-binding response OmpR family regulator
MTGGAVNLDRVVRRAAADGLTLMEAVRLYDVSDGGLRRAEARTGVRLARERLPRMDVLRRELGTMSVEEQRDHLLHIVGKVLCEADPTGVFPDISLTHKERDLLVLLYGREGRVVSHEAIFTALFDEDREIKGVAVYVYRLNRKLAQTGLRIVNSWGEGYRLERDAGVTLPWEARS